MEHEYSIQGTSQMPPTSAKMKAESMGLERPETLRASE